MPTPSVGLGDEAANGSSGAFPATNTSNVGVIEHVGQAVGAQQERVALLQGQGRKHVNLHRGI
jgi:hypothetical protein